MAKRGRKPRQHHEPVGNPVADLPTGPAMRAHLVVEQVEQHRRGNLRARRVHPLSLDGLRMADRITEEEHAAGVEFMTLARWAMGSPAPRSCCDDTVRGAPPEESRSAIRKHERWTGAWLVLGTHGNAVRTEVVHVLWEGLTCQDVDALRVGLRAIKRALA